MVEDADRILRKIDTEVRIYLSYYIDPLKEERDAIIEKKEKKQSNILMHIQVDIKEEEKRKRHLQYAIATYEEDIKQIKKKYNLKIRPYRECILNLRKEFKRQLDNICFGTEDNGYEINLEKLDCLTDKEDNFFLERIKNDKIKSLKVEYRSRYKEINTMTLCDLAEEAQDLIEQLNHCLQVYMESHYKPLTEQEISKEFYRFQRWFSFYLFNAEKAFVDNKKLPYWIIWLRNNLSSLVQKYIKVVGDGEDNLNKIMEYIDDHELNEEDTKKISKFLNDFDKKWEKISYQIQREKFFKSAQHIIEHDEVEDSITEMDLAVSTFVVFTMSRDGTGRDFSKNRYKNDDSFHKLTIKLYDCYKRLKGVEILNKSAIDEINGFSLWEEDIIAYCDPPYLQDKGIVTIDKIKLEEYNPGQYYNSSWDVIDHEDFLKKIHDCKCKMIISNYTDIFGLYDSYLTEENGWKKIEYETKTTIASTSGNFRTECGCEHGTV